MSFMRAYKHLDHLCQDMYPNARNGISGYIEDMENHPSGTYQVRGWDADYKALKHYRWVRNQIAHDEYADEKNMCDDGDVEWLENFYQRIMNQSDPLTLVYQAAKIRVEKVPAQQTSSAIPQSVDFHLYQKTKRTGCVTLIISAALVLAFAVIIYVICIVLASLPL